MDVYLRCAAICARSIAYHGYQFRLVTNDRSLVLRRLHELGIAEMEVVEQNFSLSVPEDIKFRGAHFKLELFRHFGAGQYGNYIGVIDVDSVMINPLEFPPIAPGEMLVYDITNQMIAEIGVHRVREDIENVSGKPVTDIKWYGGEFLFGHADAFGELSDVVYRNWPRYIQNWMQLGHVGDEMLVSASIPSANLKVTDVGRPGLVVRWWTARTCFQQMPFELAAQHSILHLPADKMFLAAAGADGQYNPRSLIKNFKSVARRKLFRRHIYNFGDKLLRGKGKYVATIS
jgi:hypothetical protein